MLVKSMYDVLIIGGSYAGLSAALVLGRSSRRVQVLDAGQPANRPAPHVQGLLTHDGESTSELATRAREDVSRYPGITFWQDTAVSVVRQGGTFVVNTASGVAFQARKLLLATGVTYVLPDIPGFDACWGRSVLHCPYCHGYELQGQPVGVLGNGELGYESALFTYQWSKHLTLFTNGPSTLTDDQLQRLWRLGINVVDTVIETLDHQDGLLTGVQLADHQTVSIRALFSHVSFRQAGGELVQQLGCQTTLAGLIQTTEWGETTVPDVFAAGDNNSLYRQIAQAVASGSKAGVWINRQLGADELRQGSQFVSLLNNN